MSEFPRSFVRFRDRLYIHGTGAYANALRDARRFPRPLNFAAPPWPMHKSGRSATEKRDENRSGGQEQRRRRGDS